MNAEETREAYELYMSHKESREELEIPEEAIVTRED